MKKYTIMFWITTTIIFLSEGVLTVATSHSATAIAGITHFGYPLYFVTMLVVFKTLGALALIIPWVPGRIKEWAYAGFAFDFIAAFISICVVDGFSGMAMLPLIFLLILIASYISYHKLQGNRE